MDSRTIRRALFITLAGVLAIGLSTVSAQPRPTQESAKDAGKAAVQKGAVAWDAMSAEQQDAVKAGLKTDAAAAKAKWNAMAPDQQQKVISEAKGLSEDARKKWQALPKQ
jgi:predicted Fe-S protein YdhL (DUF1289 family)